MDKILTLNKKHETHLADYIQQIDCFIYEITEEQPVAKWKMFQPLKTEAMRLHNELGKGAMKKETNPIGVAEWVFMLPNFLLFGSIGFASALKTEDNVSEINEHIEKLYVEMSDTIIKLDEMLVEQNDIDERKQIKKNKKQK